MDTYKLIAAMIFMNLFITIASLGTSATAVTQLITGKEIGTVTQNVTAKINTAYDPATQSSTQDTTRLEDTGGWSIFNVVSILLAIFGLLFGGIIAMIAMVASAITAGSSLTIISIIGVGLALVLGILNMWIVMVTYSWIKNRNTR